MRVRFTIAHEIGHIILGHEHPSVAAESEADFFARNFLVPQALLIHENIDSALMVSRLFNVSNSCANKVISALSKRKNAGLLNLSENEKKVIKLIKIRKIK